MTREEAVLFLKNEPYKFGWLVGFKDLGLLHNDWIKQMLLNEEDTTLQAHRESYKTSCVSVALCLLMLLRPNKRICFMRKTDDDVKEVVGQVRKMLVDGHTQYIAQSIYGVNLRLTKSSATELSTNLTNDIRGTSQLVGLGIGSSLTGKHFDYIFTDDIVNINDRISRAERERTKLIYQELQNVRNRGGRIFNTGTVWHKDDCFSIMPKAQVFDCYSTGLMSEAVIEQKKQAMTAALFAANYELKFIAEEDVIFDNPQTNGDRAMAEQGSCHLDAAYGGGDYTAFTIARKYDGKYYVFGKLWHRSVDECLDEIIALRQSFMGGRIYNENNADKGLLAKELRNRGERVSLYHETTNKYVKIIAYLKPVWKDVVFVEGTDKEYIDQICDFNENVDHDDAADSLASLIRAMSKRGNENDNFIPKFIL